MAVLGGGLRLWMAVAACVLAGIVLSPGSASGYAVTGYVWKYTPNHSSSTRCGFGTDPFVPCVIQMMQFPSYSTIPGWSNDAFWAEGQWGGVLDPATGSPVFGWSDTAYPYGGAGSGFGGLYGEDLGYCTGCTNVLGRNQWWADSRGIGTAQITINRNAGIAWTLGAAPTAPGTFDHAAVVTHEMGHALGLRHPTASTNTGIVMQCSLPRGENNHLLSSDDKRGVLYLYSSHRSDFASPGSAWTCGSADE